MHHSKWQRFNLPEHQVTDETTYWRRRQLLKGMGFLGAAISAPAQAGLFDIFSSESAPTASPFQNQPLTYSAQTPPPQLPLTPELKVTSHNNFYEFGTAKTDPRDNAQGLKVEPWTVTVEGEVAKPGTLDLWQWMAKAGLQERIYRMRCVEAWSMVIPWVGVELGQLLKAFEPTSRAKYVAFETLYDPEQMPGQKNRIVGGGIHYPYVEGLRMDEAMHPLTLMAVGLYGKTLPPQNGAPLRLVVPWKYGFKGIKSIVKIKLVESMPPTTWNILAPREYGFYANVNPAVDHPRWSQASERFIGPGGALKVSRQRTLPFNGYADEVAYLYKEMDLRRYY